MNVYVEVTKQGKIIKQLSFVADDTNIMDLFWLITYRYQQYYTVVDLFIDNKHSYRFYDGVLYKFEPYGKVEA
jgi:hypothetical protein